ncbi:MAG: hypothetical protein ACI8WT_000723 [Clostridium sp.]|jgi:hypothetical protein
MYYTWDIKYRGANSMKNILQYLPGFRTNKKWKKVIASIYYVLCLLMLTSGIGVFLTTISLPFIIFSIKDVTKQRNKKVILTLIGAILIFGIGSKLNGTTPEDKTVTAAKEVVAPVVKEKTPEELKIEADAKIKADAEAKVLAAQKIKDDAAAKIIADKKAIADKKIADAKAIVDKKAAAAKAVADAQIAKKAAYQTWVDAQFSVWDGSHTYLVDLIKKNLNDDKSFKHVETTYKDMGTYLIVKMTYRASNAFGATILQNVTAKADYKTNEITVTSQND